MANEDSSIKFEIINEIGVVSENRKWRLELNRVSWDGREPKYDLRRWSPNHEKKGKGVTLTNDELICLADILAKEKEFLAEDADP